MIRNPITSKTGLAGAGYDPATETLELEFASRKEGEPSKLYHYHDFTPADYDAFVAAESKGSHFMKHVKPVFKCTRVELPKEGQADAASSK